MENNDEGNTPTTRRPAKPPKALKFEVGSLEEQCPSCFYRPQEDDKSHVVVCMDGNFQHRRFKHAAKTATHHYEKNIFVDVPPDMVSVINTTPPKEETLCASNFRATAAKPQSMKMYDETGLFAMVCRYVMLNRKRDWIVH